MERSIAVGEVAAEPLLGDGSEVARLGGLLERELGVDEHRAPRRQGQRRVQEHGIARPTRGRETARAVIGDRLGRSGRHPAHHGRGVEHREQGRIVDLFEVAADPVECRRRARAGVEVHRQRRSRDEERRLAGPTGGAQVAAGGAQVGVVVGAPVGEVVVEQVSAGVGADDGEAPCGMGIGDRAGSVGVAPLASEQLDGLQQPVPTASAHLAHDERPVDQRPEAELDVGR